MTREPMYEQVARVFEEHAAESPYNAGLDRPALLALLGDVQGRRVLDIGCGPGLYARELVDRGAEVVGFDQSPAMVELAAARVPEAEFRVHDLEHPLDWLPDAAVDAAVMALVLHHVDARVAALAEIRRVLRPGGVLALSTVHPMHDWLHLGGSYFAREAVEEEWSLGLTARYWRQPLTDLVREFGEAGFLIESLVEPRPQPEMAERHPEVFAELEREPFSICFRLVQR